MNDPQQSCQVTQRAGKYSNFSDPVGLLMRMLRSGNRAAYGALFRTAFSIGLTPLDWFLQFGEKKRLAAVDESQIRHPLVLIVGPPRSGSTLLYQALARYANVSYLTNLTSMFPRSPISCASLFPTFSQRPTKSFAKSSQNYYGQTPGLRAPNDGFEVWNRWLGEDRYQAQKTLEPASAKQMRRFLAAWTKEFDKPFLNKNNRNALCMGLLADFLPQATFVIIRREPLFVVQSLIEARINVQGAKDRPWGLASHRDHAEAREPLGYVDDVCDQLFEIEKQLQGQLELVAPERAIEVTYENFCHDPQSTLRHITSSIDGLQLNEKQMSAELKPYEVSSTLRLSKEEIQRIERRFANSKSITPHFLDKCGSVTS